MGSVAPFLIFFAAAAIAAVTRGWLRSVVLLAAPIVGAVNLYLMPGDASLQIPLLDFRLELLRVDRLSQLFGYLFHLAAFLGIVFSLHVRARTEPCSGSCWRSARRF
jgi:multicomponent Na+:H+ antiporter subunit D